MVSLAGIMAQTPQVIFEAGTIEAPQATRNQAIDLQAGILVALRTRNDGPVVVKERRRGGG
jgi:hypothetical protein